MRIITDYIDLVDFRIIANKYKEEPICHHVPLSKGFFKRHSGKHYLPSVHLPKGFFDRRPDIQRLPRIEEEGAYTVENLITEYEREIARRIEACGNLFSIDSLDQNVYIETNKAYKRKLLQFYKLYSESSFADLTIDFSSLKLKDILCIIDSLISNVDEFETNLKAILLRRDAVIGLSSVGLLNKQNLKKLLSSQL